MESTRVAGGIAQFDLKEYEWYGDDPNTAGSRQQCVRQKIREQAITWRCDHAVVYVTPDDLFSVSPVPGRHKVWAENVSPIFEITNVTVKQRIKPEMYEKANLEGKAYMVDRATQTIEERMRGLERNSSVVITYEVWAGGALITKGTVR